MSAQSPEAELSKTPHGSVEDELTRLRERVAFYESFDGLIKDNIARSGDLLREAVEVRESALRSVAEAKAEAERKSEEDRNHYRELLTALLGEARQLQERADSLTTRIAAVVDRLATPETAPAVEPETVSAPDEVAAPEDTVDVEVLGGPEIVEPAPALPEPAVPTETTTILLVHGVPNAMTALSLKRFLEDLSVIDRVDPREFAEGILRIEVAGSRPLALDDITAWSADVALEPIHLRSDLVEVRLVQ
jgi:hypothetical protein